MKQIFASFALWVVFTVVLGNQEAVAQSMKVDAKLDTTQILLGDQVHLSFDVEKEEGIDIYFPELGDSISPTIEVLATYPIDSVMKDGKTFLSRRYLVTSFDSGQHVIPPFYFRFKTEGMEDSIKSKELVLNVGSFDIDLQKGAVDIKKPYEASLTFKEVVPWILGFFLVVAILFFAFYGYYRYKNKKAFFTKPPVPKEPAHIIALRELNKIKEEETWNEMDSKAYFSEITDILRQYMEDRYHIHAMESTTDEILQELKDGGHAKDREMLKELTQILQLADLVKFAKLQASEDDSRLSLANAVFFVNKTKLEEKKDDERPVDDRDGEEVVVD